MGTTYVFKCTQCDHEIESSGKLDYGMETVVEPYKCDSCNDIVDVKVGIFGSKILKEELPKDEKPQKEKKSKLCGSMLS